MPDVGAMPRQWIQKKNKKMEKRKHKRKPSEIQCSSSSIERNAKIENSKTKRLYQTSKHIFYKSKWAISEKIQTLGVEDILFWKTSGIFPFLNFTPEVPDKTKLNPRIFQEIALDPLEIPRPKTKTPGNSTFFLGHPWKFHFVFN